MENTLQHHRTRRFTWCLVAGSMLSAVTLAVASFSVAGATSRSDRVSSQSARPATSRATHLSIGIVTFSTSDVATQDMVESVTAEAHAKGWTTSFVDANGSPDTANTAMVDFVQRKVNVIIVFVMASSLLGEGLRAAQAAGIPVLSHGGGLAPGVALQDDDGDAAPMINLMFNSMHNHGKVLNLTYHGGRPCQERASAVEAAAAKLPGITITNKEVTVPGESVTAQGFTLAWLAANPATKGVNYSIFNCFDDDAVGAIAALKEDHRTDVKVYSFNAEPPALTQVKAGWMTATLYGNLPSAGAELLAKIPAILAAGKKWKPESFLVPYIVVTKSNLASFLKSHPGA